MDIKSEVIVVENYQIKKSIKKAHIPKKERNVFIRKQDNTESIICQTFSNRRRKKREVNIKRGRDIIKLSRGDSERIERIVPGCMRRTCYCKHKLHRKTKVKKSRKKCKSKCKKHKNTTINKNNIYENISSDSFYSDSDIDELIRATRKRMKAQYSEWPTPIFHTSTPIEEDLDSTVELNSIHSLETVVLNNVEDFCWPMENTLTNYPYSPLLSPIRSVNIKKERNNNDIDNTNYSPSMAIEDLKIDIKPVKIEKTYDDSCSPISDEYLFDVE
ncbi:uncharacterized protein LOC123699875 [Colias croceus]|uniref:uncharacterized protein LOC123699875 n=1 Tax=Colias crocea TaxID=72248 RepID=UPI001E280147|nr:uncharacterized protein LOC123699875 [Colias croceus]